MVRHLPRFEGPYVSQPTPAGPSEDGRRSVWVPGERGSPRAFPTGSPFRIPSALAGESPGGPPTSCGGGQSSCVAAEGLANHNFHGGGVLGGAPANQSLYQISDRRGVFRPYATMTTAGLDAQAFLALSLAAIPTPLLPIQPVIFGAGGIAMKYPKRRWM